MTIIKSRSRRTSPPYSQVNEQGFEYLWNNFAFGNHVSFECFNIAKHDIIEQAGTLLRLNLFAWLKFLLISFEPLVL